MRAVHRNSDLELDNVLCAYKVLSTGDIRIYVDEPVSLRVTVGRGVPVTTNGITGKVTNLQTLKLDSQSRQS